MFFKKKTFFFCLDKHLIKVPTFFYCIQVERLPVHSCQICSHEGSQGGEDLQETRMNTDKSKSVSAVIKADASVVL